MIIRAHDAYSLGCCVDGIADVLALAQQWVVKLEAGKEYQLMVCVCVVCVHVCVGVMCGWVWVLCVHARTHLCTHMHVYGMCSPALMSNLGPIV